jgi:hypothetical protein
LFSLLCLVSAWQLWRVGDGIADRRERAMWRGLASVLVMLAINDLVESAITDLLRSRAMQQGWYEGRQIIQLGFIVIAGATCLLACSFLLFLVRGTPHATKIGVVALTLLLTLALVRGTSLHEVDHLLGKRVLGLKLNRIIEIGGLALVMLASEWRRRLLQSSCRR